MSKNFNIKEFAAKVKNSLEQEFSKERACLESIYNDTEILSSDEKEKILDYVLNHGWSAENALEHFLAEKYKEENKHKIISELYPEVYEKLCAE